MIRQAIKTKYLAPTNHRGARVVASCDSGRYTVAWDFGLDTDGNCLMAAVALARELGWDITGEGASHGDCIYWMVK